MNGPCPQCARLRDALDEAREEALQLRALLGDSETGLMQLMRLGLTRQEARVWGVLLARESASRDSIAALLYGDAERQPNPRTIDSLICRSRDVLGLYGVKLESLRGIGWRLDAASKRKLRDAIAERAA